MICSFHLPFHQSSHWPVNLWNLRKHNLDNSGRGYSADYRHTKENQEDIIDIEAVLSCPDVMRAVYYLLFHQNECSAMGWANWEPKPLHLFAYMEVSSRFCYLSGRTPCESPNWGLEYLMEQEGVLFPCCQGYSEWRSQKIWSGPDFTRGQAALNDLIERASSSSK